MIPRLWFETLVSHLPLPAQIQQNRDFFMVERCLVVVEHTGYGMKSENYYEFVKVEPFSHVESYTELGEVFGEFLSGIC